LNARTPRFYNKKNRNLKDKDTIEDIPLKKAILASASSPRYFKPADINGDIMISGEYVARSPAAFAFFYANEQNGIPFDNMRVLSIGTVNDLPEKVDGNVGLLDWAKRLSTLAAPAKAHSYDYLIEIISRHFGKDFIKISINFDFEKSQNLYYDDDRREEVDQLF